MHIAQALNCEHCRNCIRCCYCKTTLGMRQGYKAALSTELRPAALTSVVNDASMRNGRDYQLWPRDHPQGLVSQMRTDEHRQGWLDFVPSAGSRYDSH